MSDGIQVATTRLLFPELEVIVACLLCESRLIFGSPSIREMGVLRIGHAAIVLDVRS